MLKGSIVALITPFTSENEVDYAELKRLCKFHLDNNTNGIVALGTTAEASSLSLEEKRKIVITIKNEIHDKIDLCIGLIANTIDDVLANYDNVKDVECDSYLIIDPYYIKSNEIGLINYFNFLADRINKPIILYNVPSRTGEVIPISVVKELKYHQNIVGIKDASSDISYHIELIKLQDENFKIYSGNDITMLSSIGLGSSGVISVIANALPKEISFIFNSYFKDLNKSKKTYYSIFQVIKSIYLEVSPIGIKYLMYLLGFNTLKYRFPLAIPKNSIKRKIEEELLNFIE